VMAQTPEEVKRRATPALEGAFRMLNPAYAKERGQLLTHNRLMRVNTDLPAPPITKRFRETSTMDLEGAMPSSSSSHDLQGFAAEVDNMSMRAVMLSDLRMLDLQCQTLHEIKKRFFKQQTVEKPEETTKYISRHLINARILLVASQRASSSLIKRWLMRSQFELTLLKTGKEAWDHLKKKPGATDLCLFDVGISEISGIDLLKMLRKDPQLCDMPVILMSSSLDASKVPLSSPSFHPSPSVHPSRLTLPMFP
jgi:CheY-like chemotaxis protein